METFIKLFAEQFDETDASEFSTNTRFHDLDEWSSLTGLAVLNMIAKKYGVKISPSELKEASTIGCVYNLIKSKQ